MPLTDKEIAIQLLELTENLMVRDTILQIMLQRRDPDWQQKYQKVFAQNQDAVRKAIRPNLERARTLVLEAPDLSTVVEQLLRDIPRNNPE
jgi:hypothetical protein